MGRPPVYPDDPRICASCGEYFTRRDNETRLAFNKRRTCSRACFSAWCTIHQTRVTEPKPCALCGREFQRAPGQPTYEFNKRQTCSEECRRLLAGLKERRPAPLRLCPVCGSPIPGRYAKTCSFSCSVKITPQRIRKPVASKWCRACGVELERRDRESLDSFNKRQTCSNECRYIWAHRPAVYLESVRNSPYPLDWSDRLRKRIRERDGNRCVLCGDESNRISIHHIDYVKANCLPSNLISLCGSCHTKTNFNRERWRLRLQALMRSRGLSD